MVRMIMSFFILVDFGKLGIELCVFKKCYMLEFFYSDLWYILKVLRK